jgi:2-methylisocitrate lyase-like PEP mutase family enzyme
MKATKKIRALLKRDEILITLGAYDALSAKVFEQAGIQAIYTTGFGISASHIGKPDAELYTMTENLQVVKNMVSTVEIPILADLDTGYGNAINVMRTVKEFERAGCAGGFIEDQLAPKRCPACVDAFNIIPLEEALGKIKAAVDARENPDFLIVARTDAVGQEGIDRANAYFEAGAELVLFISKAFRSLPEMKKLTKNLKPPFCLNIFEDVNYPAWFQGEWKMEDLKEMGVKLLNFPLVPLFAATYALREVATHIARHQTVRGLHHPLRIGHEEFNHLIGFPQLSALQTKYMPSSKVIWGK